MEAGVVKMFKIGFGVLLNGIPILIMIGLIPVVADDYVLTALYAGIIAGAFVIKRTKNDLPVFVFGFVVMIVAESIFISTDVETFTRHSLFGLMPLWLPFLWGYSFVAIKRSIPLLDS
jgi:hypothetical protein